MITPASRTRGAAWALLAMALLLHGLMLESLRSGRMDFLYNDAVHRKGRAVDFFTVYWGSLQGLEGHSLYQYDLPQGRPGEPPYAYSNFRYFPGFAFSIGRILTLLDPWRSYGLWLALSELLWVAGALWAVRLAGRWGSGAAGQLAVGALWLGYTPGYLELYLGQFTLPLTLAILWLVSLAVRGQERALARGWVASLLWKFATSLYLPVFHRRRAWGAIGFGALAVGLFTVPYFVWHPADLPRFARYFVMGLGAKTHAGNHGLQALASVFLESVWPPAWTWTIRGIEVPLWRGLALLATLGLVGVAWRRTWVGRDEVGLQLCLWTCMYFAISRDVWEHHTLMLLPVLTYLLATQVHRRLGVGLAALALALPTPLAALDLPMPPEVDPEPYWGLAARLAYHACKALPAAWLLWVCYRELAPPKILRS